VFTDEQRNKSATIAQILWEHEEQVKELFAITPDRRSLSDLLGNHSNTGEIRRASRRNGWQIEDSFAPYAERMRGLLHIPGDKTLEGFNRAIGMKEVGDIDAFVRQFMLPSASTFAFKGYCSASLSDSARLLDCDRTSRTADRLIAACRGTRCADR
jgi:uncharacterized protein YPO0396